MSGFRKISLSPPTSMNNSVISVLTGGRVHFSSSDSQGAGILSFSDMMSWCVREHVEFPALIRIEIALSRGKIYGQYFDAAFRAPISTPETLKEGERKLYLYIENPQHGASLMMGVYETPVEGEITDLAIGARSSMDPAEYKRIRANMFPHWYYSCDLKHGVGRAATVSDEKSATVAAQNNLKIMLRMIEKHFGSVEGLKVLDVACSAGLHSLALARGGAIVTGIDWDSAAIAQAKFIQECIADDLRHRVDFQHTDLFSFKAPPKSFDLVYCSGLFYHLQDPIGAARRLANLCSRGAVMQCCITAREGDLLELSHPAKFPFCASWEFALVPTGTMLRKILETASFEVEEMRDLAEFSIDGDRVNEQRCRESVITTGPVYLALKAPLGDGAQPEKTTELPQEDARAENSNRAAGAVTRLRRIFRRLLN
jgi:SAM-dependent methyltransferase